MSMTMIKIKPQLKLSTVYLTVTILITSATLIGLFGYLLLEGIIYNFSQPVTELTFVNLMDDFTVDISSNTNIATSSEVIWDGSSSYRPLLTTDDNGVPLSQLVARWTFDDTFNNTIAGQANFLTQGGSPVFTSDAWRNKAVEFFDRSGVWLLTDKAISLSNNFSLSIWFKSTSNRLYRTDEIVVTDSLVTATTGFRVQYRDFGSTDRMRIFIGGINYYLSLPNNQCFNGYCHYVLSVEPNGLGGSIIKNYLNGVLKYQTTAPTALAVNSKIRLSKYANNTTETAMKIDDLIFWSRTLNTSEITSIYQGAAPPINSAFTSNSIYGEPYQSLNVDWAETNSDISLEVSTDEGLNWCALVNHSSLADENCQLPANDLRYRVRFSGDTSLDNVEFTLTPLNACGDGNLNAGEACDDGNTNEGDGCSSSCNIEFGWRCEESPSVCQRLLRSSFLGNDPEAIRIASGETQVVLPSNWSFRDRDIKWRLVNALRMIGYEKYGIPWGSTIGQNEIIAIDEDLYQIEQVIATQAAKLPFYSSIAGPNFRDNIPQVYAAYLWATIFDLLNAGPVDYQIYTADCLFSTIIGHLCGNLVDSTDGTGIRCKLGQPIRRYPPIIQSPQLFGWATRTSEIMADEYPPYSAPSFHSLLGGMIHEIAHDLDYAFRNSFPPWIGYPVGFNDYSRSEACTGQFMRYYDLENNPFVYTGPNGGQNPDDFVSGYAAGLTIPGQPYYSWEDYAESIAAYILTPELFRARALNSVILQAKYDFIKDNFFGGVEFSNPYIRNIPGLGDVIDSVILGSQFIDRIQLQKLVISDIEKFTCGNGSQESIEGCDDGNTTSGDGCSASCQLEN